MSALAVEPATTTGLRPGAFGNAVALTCRECGHQRELGRVGPRRLNMTSAWRLICMSSTIRSALV